MARTIRVLSLAVLAVTHFFHELERNELDDPATQEPLAGSGGRPVISRRFRFLVA